MFEKMDFLLLYDDFFASVFVVIFVLADRICNAFSTDIDSKFRERVSEWLNKLMWIQRSEMSFSEEKKTSIE